MVKSNEVLIDVQGLNKVFVTEEVETHALSSVHLKIHRGEYIAIAGPSGCGKSTLLSILGLLDSPSEGDYNLNNNPVGNATIAIDYVGAGVGDYVLVGSAPGLAANVFKVKKAPMRELIMGIIDRVETAETETPFGNSC